MKNLMLCVGCVSLFAVGAGANTILTLDQPNSDLSPYSGPFGTATVQLIDSTHATVEFTVNPGFVFVDGSAVDFNLNTKSGSGTATLGSVSPVVGLSPEGFGNADGFGTFDVRMTSGNSGPGGRFTDVVLNLEIIGDTWNSSDEVLADNEKGHPVAAHIGVGGLSGDLRTTGFASTGSGAVPDATSTAALIGLASLALGSARRWFVK